ncbi:MAG: polyketide synthase [Elusimicrobia bacterium RIFOXYD2_FULL_34_15]|nr:MAG: polyketide synthase [Elusimicrobia bacterium RIFOXYD2_FULL_34_15]
MKIKEKKDSVHIASIATVVPSFSASQQEAEMFVNKNYKDKLNSRAFSILHRALNHSSIQKRHYNLDNLEILLNENADAKIKRFTNSSIELSSKAIKEALLKAGVSVQDVTGLVVNTCTGYICPGISTYLIENLGLGHDIQTYDLVGSGCGGAIPNLTVAEALLRELPDNIVLSVSVEICSSTFQMTNDPSQLISDCIFGDGASAAVLWNRPEGIQLVASKSNYIPEYREDIRFIHKDGQLHNQLSSRLPSLTGKAANELIENILEKYELEKEDINHWAFHPGGENVINSLRDEVSLSDEQLRHTRSVLSKYGNMSSPTVMFVLKEILDKGVNPGDWLVAASYGAGFSAHAYLLRA